MSDSTLIANATRVLKAQAPRLAQVPEERIAQKIGSTIVGIVIGLIGLGIITGAVYIMASAKTVTTLSLILLGVGVVVLFAGGTTASKDLLVSLMNLATLGKTVYRTVRPAKP